MTSFRLEGLIAATFTPLDDKGRLNLDAVPQMVDQLLADGVAGLYVGGGTGEGPALTGAERRQTAEAFVRAAAGRLPVVVHVGHASVAEACELAAHAAAIGADAIAAVPPYYYRPDSVQALVHSLAEIAAAAPQTPLYYYHIPRMTAVALDVAELLERAPRAVPSLAGVKFSDHRLDQFRQCLVAAGGRYDILSGYDEMLLGYLALGGRGAVGTTYNFAAPLYRRLIEAFDRGDLPSARRHQDRAIALVTALCRWPVFASGKAAMRLVGIDCGPCRPPLPVLDDRAFDALRRELETIGFFEWGRRAAA